MFDEWVHEATPAFAVRAEGGFGVAKVALEDYDGAVVERMGEWSGRVNPVQAVRLQR